MKGGRELVSQRKRQSTDIICLIFFTFSTIAILIAGIYSYIQGSTSKFTIPYDSDGKGCGLDYPGYNYIYFPSPQLDSLWVTTCVKECPLSAGTTIACKTNSVVTACIENNSVNNTQAFHIYETTTFRDSICLPTASTIKQRVLGSIKANFIEEMFGSVIKNWSLFFIVIPIAAVISLLAVFLIRVIAGYVVYIFYIFIILAFLIFGIYLVIPIENSTTQTFILKQNTAIAITLSVICFILSIGMLFLFISFKDKIKLTVQYIDKSNQFFKQNYSILILSSILTGCAIAFIFFWLFLTLSFYSLAEPYQTTHQLPYQHFKFTPLLITILVLSIFYLLWALFFLMHTAKFIISGTLISWRFNRKNPYVNASKVYLSSHIGSACLSSLLTTLFGLFKFQVDEAECGEVQQSENKCISFFNKCFSCLCCCCVNFIFHCFHHAGFSYLNMSGLAYCQSSTEVQVLIHEDKATWKAVNLLYNVFNNLIPFIFAGGNMLFSNFLISSISSYNNNTANRILLLLIVGITTYTVSHFFLVVYSETVLTTFVVQQFYIQMPNKQKYPLNPSGQGNRKSEKRVEGSEPPISRAQSKN